MRRIVILILIHTFSIAGLAQEPHWRDGEASIPASTNLDIQWAAPTAALPGKVWIYRLLPNKFSPEIISNITGLVTLTEKDKINSTRDEIIFKSPDGTRKLTVTSRSGSIVYETVERQYSSTNLAKEVPTISQLPGLASNFVSMAGISLSDITNPYTAGTGAFGNPKFHLSEPLRVYYVGSNSITNVEYRTVKFWRRVDGIPVIGGDGGTITFGEHGKIRSFSLVWRTLERYQNRSSVSPETAMKSLREGKAVQELVKGEIDWTRVKVVTIKKASPLYCDGQTEWLWPFLGLAASSEPSYGHTQFGIDCPMVDESKL